VCVFEWATTNFRNFFLAFLNESIMMVAELRYFTALQD